MDKKHEALRALDRLYKEAARMGEYYGSGLIKDCYRTIRAALTEAPKVDVDITAWPQTSSFWKGDELYWMIEGQEISDRMLRSWCFHNMEHNHEKHVDVIRHYHVVTWAKANLKTTHYDLVKKEKKND